MSQHPDNDSVQEWLEHARRAQELVGRVDLEKVVRHDPVEIDKLSRVAGALTCLSNGQRVDHLPGVDVDVDEAPALNPDNMRRAELMEVLAAEGLADRLGRVFVTDGETEEIRPLDLVPHRQGLPDFLLCVAPDFSPTEGAQGVFISERGVFAATVPEPVTGHRWRVARSRPYDSEREMIASVRHFIAREAD